MTSLLKTIDLSCERDGRLLVDQLNLSIEAGCIYQLEGPNGSGKTSLLRVLCGLSSRYSGELLWREKPIRYQRNEFHSQLLYLGHSTGVKAALTPRENLQWQSSLMGISRQQLDPLIEQALTKVGLYGYEDAACFTLSAGQQRRVGLARLFVSQACLWILDEPFTAIDKHGVAELEAWIQAFVGGGGSVLLTTHHELNMDCPVHHIRLGV